MKNFHDTVEEHKIHIPLRTTSMNLIIGYPLQVLYHDIEIWHPYKSQLQHKIY